MEQPAFNEHRITAGKSFAMCHNNNISVTGVKFITLALVPYILSLTVIDKVMEKLMCKRLCNFLQEYKILYEFQFGFRKHHSTILAVTEVLDSIYQHLDREEFTIGIFLDLQKAFDTVNHDILLYKLNNCGVRGVVNQWFKSYLSERRQITAIRDSCSEVGSITVGVPQGSVLGPVLFLLYINDICNAIPDTKIKLFADDSNLFIYDKSITNLYYRANQSLSQLSKWFLANKLSLNVDKTCYSIFGSQPYDSSPINWR